MTSRQRRGYTSCSGLSRKSADLSAAYNAESDRSELAAPGLVGPGSEGREPHRVERSCDLAPVVAAAAPAELLGQALQR
jgi:hypothetical protein